MASFDFCLPVNMERVIPIEWGVKSFSTSMENYPKAKNWFRTASELGC